MPHPLDGAHLRAQRADKHLSEAGNLLDDFSRDCTRYIVRTNDPKTGKPTVKIDGTPPLPVTLPLAVSDAIHNLRSALDYIVFELALHDSGTAQNGTQFIIEDVKSDPVNPKRGFDARSKQYLKGLSPIHVDAIEALQPYKGVEWTKTLRDISNPDKHRRLIDLTAEDGWFTLIATPGTDGDGVVITGIGYDDYNWKVQAHYSVSIADEDRGFPSLMSTLRRLEHAVFSTIEAFKPEF